MLLILNSSVTSMATKLKVLKMLKVVARVKMPCMLVGACEDTSAELKGRACLNDRVAWIRRFIPMLEREGFTSTSTP